MKHKKAAIVLKVFGILALFALLWAGAAALRHTAMGEIPPVVTESYGEGFSRSIDTGWHVYTYRLLDLVFALSLTCVILLFLTAQRRLSRRALHFVAAVVLGNLLSGGVMSWHSNWQAYTSTPFLSFVNLFYGVTFNPIDMYLPVYYLHMIVVVAGMCLYYAAALLLSPEE